MADWDDVRRTPMSLPEVEEPKPHQWKVGGKGIAWERPLRKSDFEALGDAAPPDPILALRVSDELAKEALVSGDPDIYFTTPHFDGYPTVLVQLDNIAVDELQELLVEAWLVRAPKRLARQFLEGE